jgi:hypothetical protein
MVVLGCTQGALLCFLFEPVGLGQYSNHPGFLDSKEINDPLQQKDTSNTSQGGIRIKGMGNMLTVKE